MYKKFRQKIIKLLRDLIKRLFQPLYFSIFQEYENRLTKIENTILEINDNKLTRMEHTILEVNDNINNLFKSMFEHISGSNYLNAMFTMNSINKNINKEIDSIRWNIQDTNRNVVDMLYQQNHMPLYKGEKIRIIFLFHIPSVWASWDSVWKIITRDDRFEVKMLLFGRVIFEKEQIEGASKFLEEKGIPFEDADYFDFDNWRPHILMYQSPWENGLRPRYLQGDQIKKRGIRLAYIPYGIEYPDHPDMGISFSNTSFKANLWRMYTLSEKMKNEHMLKTPQPQGYNYIVVSGHPKFDAFANREKFKLSNEYKTKIANKKIVFWCLHFPMEIRENLTVPFLEEYINFSRIMNKYSDLFFLIRPHPRFFAEYKRLGYNDEIDEFYNIIEDSSNADLFLEPDYRSALLSANYVIGDRSALMIETCALQIPAIYMTNFFYMEPILPAVAPIFYSYYQGTTCHDIEMFIDIVINKEIDYKREERAEALKECLPYLDGKCGQRIVDDLASSIYAERNWRR